MKSCGQVCGTSGDPTHAQPCMTFGGKEETSNISLDWTVYHSTVQENGIFFKIVCYIWIPKLPNRIVLILDNITFTQLFHVKTSSLCRVYLYYTIYKRRRRTKLLVYAARWRWQKQLQEDGHGGEAATVSNIGGEVGSIPPYATLIPSGPKKLFGQSFKVVSLLSYIGMSNLTLLVLKGGSMEWHHMGPIRKHPDRRFCLILTANGSVGWEIECFPTVWATKVSPQNFLYTNPFKTHGT